MKVMVEMINCLQKGQEITFTYNEKDYILKIHHMNQYGNYMDVRPAGKNYLGSSMNVGKVTKNAITMFDYNMMNVRSDYRMKMVNISNVELIDNRQTVAEKYGLYDTTTVLNNIPECISTTTYDTDGNQTSHVQHDVVGESHDPNIY